MNIGLVGMTNVGKSTLFNRLIGQHRAIITDISGTTTDILTHDISCQQFLLNKKCSLPSMEASSPEVAKTTLRFLDSPGLDSFDAERPFIQRVIQQSDVILFLVDHTLGMTARDQDIHHYITQQGKTSQTCLLVNKIDQTLNHETITATLSERYRFAYHHILPISAAHYHGFDQLHEYLLTHIEHHIQQLKSPIKEQKLTQEIVGTTVEVPPHIAFLGKPNAGKSTLMNTLSKQALSKVSEIAGTTRDYLSGKITYQGQEYIVYDTAGIKKKTQHKTIESIAYKKTIKMLEYVQPIGIFLIDGTVGLTHRDQTLLREIHILGTPLIIAINKIDLLDKHERKRVREYVRDFVPFLDHAPLVEMVAKTGKGMQKLFESIHHIGQHRGKHISTSALNKAIQQAWIKKPPRFPKNKTCKILYLTQVSDTPCRFKVFINHRRRVTSAFKKRIERVLRQAFHFPGQPLFLHFVEREGKKG